MSGRFQIQVLESGHVYSNGEFVANLIFHGVHDDNVCNFTGVVKICENRAQINDTSCPRYRKCCAHVACPSWTCSRMKFGFDEFIWNQDCSDNKINFTGNRESRYKNTSTLKQAHHALNSTLIKRKVWHRQSSLWVAIHCQRRWSRHVHLDTAIHLSGPGWSMAQLHLAHLIYCW